MNVTQGNIFVKNLSFKRNDTPTGNFKLKPTLSKRIGKISSSIYFLQLNYDVVSTEEVPFPFDLSVSIEWQFSFVDVTDENQVYNFLNTTGVQGLFPYLRSIITGLTTQALVNPIILPLFGFKDIVDVQ